MIDHLLRFADEASAIAAVPRFHGEEGWNRSLCLTSSDPVPLQVYTVAGTQTVTDADTGQTYQQEIRSVLPYWYLWIGLPAQDAALTAISMIVTDRDASNAGKPFVLFSRIPADQLGEYHVTPVVAGSNYPFGTTQSPK
jgi:hypothetical protein